MRPNSPDPTQVDSCLAVNADNTVSVFPGDYELARAHGRGSRRSSLKSSTCRWTVS